MDNIKEFKVNGTKYGLNLSEIGAVINDGATQKEIKQYIDENAGSCVGGSSKVVRINFDWYNNTDGYQSEIKKALEDIYNEVSNNRTVTVVTNGFYSQPQESVLETTNVIAKNQNDVTVYFLGNENHLLRFSLIYDEGSNSYVCGAGDGKIPSKSDFYLPYVYTDGQINIDKNEGNIAEFISEPTVDNEEFVVIKTTVPAFKEGMNINRSYKAFDFYPWDDTPGLYGDTYFLSRFGGIKLYQDEYDSNYDLIPDGEWYVIFGDIQAATYVKCIVTKSVRNVDGSLDVYLGFKGKNIDDVHFFDCTVENPDEQGNDGLWSDKNWVKVSDSQRISVDSFIGRRTRYFCTNTEGVKVDRLVLFKRMK